MLELLAGPLLVTVGNSFVIDLHNVWETVDNEGAKKYSVRNFVLLNRETHQIGKSFKLRYLDETVDVVVLEEETFQFQKALQLRNV